MRLHQLVRLPHLVRLPQPVMLSPLVRLPHLVTQPNLGWRYTSFWESASAGTIVFGALTSLGSNQTGSSILAIWEGVGGILLKKISTNLTYKNWVALKENSVVINFNIKKKLLYYI